MFEKIWGPARGGRRPGRARPALHRPPSLARRHHRGVHPSGQERTPPDGAVHRFEVDPFRKEMLLAGRDEIGLTLGFEAKIREFKTRHAREMAWAVPPRTSA